MASETACPSCGKDLSRPYAVRVEYVTAVNTSLTADGRILLASSDEVADEARTAEPRTASCTACDGEFIISSDDLDGTEWA